MTRNEFRDTEATVQKFAQKIGAFAGLLAVDSTEHADRDYAATLWLNCKLARKQLEKLEKELNAKFQLEGGQ